MSTIHDFANAMRSAGLTPPDVIQADGKLRRFSTNGRRSDDAGWYVLHADAIPAGAFGCWRSGISETWRADIGRTLTPAEEAAHRAKVEAMRRIRDAEEARKHAAARKEAEPIWKAGQPAPEDHPYLRAKGIKPHPARVHEGALLIPLRDQTGKLHSLQLISPDGTKKFLSGGRVSACYSPIGKPYHPRVWINQTLCIVEGFATGASVYEATAYPTACAMFADNLLPVARVIREKFPQIRIIIAGDNDENGTGQRQAEDAARAVGGLVAIPADAGKDWNDIHQEHGAEAVHAAIEKAQSVSPPVKDSPTEDRQCTADAETIARLAALPPFEYERVRKAEAKRLNVRSTVLDKQIERARGSEVEVEERVRGSEVEVESFHAFTERDPWPDSVNGERLLDSVTASCRQFVVLPKYADVALALWVIFTYLIEAVSVAAILALVSPEKRCGKTTLLDWLSHLVCRAMPASNISPSALFRSVETWRPTLLIDEADTFLGSNEELRGILNSGHTRATAYVVRTVGEDFEPTPFSTWGAKAIALIGKLPDTLQDRAIAIELRRKLPTESVEKLRHADPAEFDKLARQCARFAADNAVRIRVARPSIPDELNDRAADNWEPLLAIADAAGGKWPELARKAASALSGASPDSDSTKTELLRDIQAAVVGGFDEEGHFVKGRFAGRDKVGSAELVEALTADPAGRWCEFSRGKALTQRQLARLLESFRIKPASVREGATTMKGYRTDSFKDNFDRYLPPLDPSQRHKPNQSTSCMENPSVTEHAALRIENDDKPMIQMPCDGVPDENPLSGGEQDSEVL